MNPQNLHLWVKFVAGQILQQWKESFANNQTFLIDILKQDNFPVTVYVKI